MSWGSLSRLEVYFIDGHRIISVTRRLTNKIKEKNIWNNQLKRPDVNLWGNGRYGIAVKDHMAQGPANFSIRYPLHKLNEIELNQNLLQLHWKIESYKKKKWYTFNQCCGSVKIIWIRITAFKSLFCQKKKKRFCHLKIS